MFVDEILKKVNRVHFIGIGGSGMCPIAEILIQKGYTVTGSDNNTGDNINKLRSLGAEITLVQTPKNLTGAEMIVYSAAILPDNPELIVAKNSYIPTFERSEVFGALTRMYDDCIGVCGTHGKTTVTSLLTEVFYKSGKDPGALIGGYLPSIDAHGRFGNSDIFICEACEFKDTFLHLSPDYAIITNIDADHMEYFKTMDNLINSFHKFLSMAKKGVYYNGDDENTLKAVKGLDKNICKKFGFSKDNDIYPENISYNRGSFPEFDVILHGENIGRIKLNIPGEHNIINALSVILVAYDFELDLDDIKEHLENFTGAKRRFEILGQKNGFTVADDYAHHPAELKVTLEAAMKMDYNEVWAVFQPFTFSRTARLFDDFVEVLQIPDHTILTPIMGSREVNTFGIKSEDLQKKIPNSHICETFEDVKKFVIENAKPKDLVITLGCGDIYKAANLIIGEGE